MLILIGEFAVVRSPDLCMQGSVYNLITNFIRLVSTHIVTAYALPADANIRDIDAIWRAVKEHHHSAASVLELDASAVERPDTAFVQLLSVTVLRSREQGKLVRVINASQRLRDLLKLVALEMVLVE